MKLKNKDVIEKKREFPISKTLYAIASIIGIMGIVLLADNIYIFKSTIDQYVAQGYTSADVIKGLIPSQLVPGIFEPIAIYGGIAFILLGVGIANKKISEHFIALSNVENQDEVLVEERIVTENLDGRIVMEDLDGRIVTEEIERI